MQYILKAIWKSKHWHLTLSTASTLNLLFHFKNVSEIVKHLWPVKLLCSIIWHHYQFATITYFSKKKLFEFLEHPSVSIAKEVVLIKILGNFPIKYPFWSPLFKYICRTSRCVKDHSPEKVHVHCRHAKERTRKKCQADTEVCTCNHMSHMTKLELVIYSLFLDQRYTCSSMQNI